MSKMNKRDSLLLMIIGFVVVVGGIFWFYVKPDKADLQAKQTASAEAQDNVTRLRAELTKLTQETKKPTLVPIADELRLAKAYPYSEDVPVLILQLEDLAKQTKVELDSASPAAGTDYAGVTGTPFSIAVTGKYWDVQDFLYRVHNRVSVDGKGRLEVKGRLLAVTKADLAPAGGDAAAGATTTASTQVTANITIVAFSRTAGATGGTGAGDPAAPAAPTSTNTGGTTT